MKMEDIQSWWEVPSIAYFCSLFRTAFNLLDFDIEELEEALLTDGTEESASSLLTELIVRLLNGCLGNNDISAFNYQMYLRRLFRRKCQETGRYNPFNTDIDFQFLPLRTKVEILYALCDFRLDAEDVFDLFKNLEAESLRVEPLGWDDNYSAYWYFYGTRLYREDIIRKTKGKNKKKKVKESRKRSWFYGDDWLDEEETERVWQVVCFTEEDWAHLTEKFSKATSKVEKELYRSLSQNFLPEIPRLFQEKERLQRKRLLELAPRRTSNRVLKKIKQKEEESKQSTDDNKDEEEEPKNTAERARENRARRRNLLRSKSASSVSSESSESTKEEMPQKVSKRSKSNDKRSKNSSATHKGEPPPDPPVKTGRKTNNSLASATGQIVIPDNDEPVNSTRKKLKTSQIFSQSEEDIQTDMYKVLEQITAHEDAWPFIDPVEEEYAPNYYAVIRRPMDLRKMEERLDTGFYTDFSMFKADFKLIVNNCRLYNGQDNEYTMMVDNLQIAFDRLTEKYMHRLSSSDEEIAVEYQLPTPSRKHKLKPESPPPQPRKKRKSHSEAGEPKSSSSDVIQDDKPEEDDKEEVTSETKKSKESHKNKQGKGKKKRKGHHRHGKHSKNHKKQHGESKSKHSKKQKHDKSKEGKKLKQKKKKSKHHEQEPETNESDVRAATPESLESSNRSRSASPLPSIHTPSPSPSPPPSPSKLDAPEPDPEPSDQLSDPDFFKDKYDKIKERRRHAAKDAWESLFDYKQKTGEKQKSSSSIPERDKNPKLRETIEKLKAKNEKYKDTTMFKNIFTPGNGNEDNLGSKVDKDESKKDTTSDDEDKDKSLKTKGKKGHKKNSAKNESASEALEEAVKDISKWLEDAPKGSNVSSPCDSPAQTISTEEQDSRQDDEFSQSDKSVYNKKELTRKRHSSREPKIVKRREIQRTIDRLQPGKSKGNLLTNISSKNTDKVEESATLGTINKVREISKSEESSPKLSLGSVLPTVEFSLGKDHKFDNKETKVEAQKVVAQEQDDEKKNIATPDNVKAEIEKKNDDAVTKVTKKDAEVETEPQIPPKPSQEKATPNLSAWFKAFGAPKSTSVTNVVKKKSDDTETEEKVPEAPSQDTKPASPKNPVKYDSPADPDTPNPDGGDSPLPNVNATPRQRRTSTGSSVSERSSFSQDLDSPRHQMSHTSPLLRSPASPRTDDFQKITYPIINGSVRAGFYQDTTSIKSSPEKSCSPREAPQSPYSPYNQHVYASNNAMGSSTPNYFIDHNKSPLPTFNQNPPTFYEAAKVATATTKQTRTHDEYPTVGQETYPQNQYLRPYSPAYSPYQQTTTTSNYSQIQHSPQPIMTNSPSNVSQVTVDTKTTHFPVKKRMYNEPEQSALISPTKTIENKEPIATQNKNDFSKSLHSVPQTSVDDIALALSEKSELAKLRERTSTDYSAIERHHEHRETPKTEHTEIAHESKKEPTIENKPIGMLKKDNIDMVNMGYMNPEIDRRNSVEIHDGDYSVVRDVAKASINSQQKIYDVDAIALNLGINSQPLQKTLTKAPVSGTVPPAHTQERLHTDINQTAAHTHHQNQYEHLPSGQPISNFSISDIELANKKLYACNTSSSPVAIDYIKLANHMRKQEMMPSDYSTQYNMNTSDKLKNEMSAANTNAINYNKSMQHPQYNMYNVPRSTAQRAQEIQQLPSELRIPNPRGILKNDHMSSAPAINEPEASTKNVESVTKTQKPEKLVQNHPLVTSNPYKTPYSNSTLPLDSLRNLPNIPQMLERYTNDERFLTTFAGSSSSLYHEKQFQMAQMFNKSMSADLPQTSSTSSSMIYSQPSASINKDNIVYKHNSVPTHQQSDPKAKNKRKRTAETKPAPIVSQAYHNPCTSDVLSSVKTGMMPASAFNFGTSTNMALSSGLYGDNTGFSPNPLMAANYMVAAAAHQHQQRSTVDTNAEKIVKPAHQNSSHSTSTFPFIGHTQVRAGYPFVGAEPSSPLYQQYLQRHQEELLRQTGAQIMSLYPAGYPAGLGVRQPYDSMNINRHSWL